MTLIELSNYNSGRFYIFSPRNKAPVLPPALSRMPGISVLHRQADIAPPLISTAPCLARRIFTTLKLQVAKHFIADEICVETEIVSGNYLSFLSFIALHLPPIKFQRLLQYHRSQSIVTLQWPRSSEAFYIFTASPRINFLYLQKGTLSPDRVDVC